MAPVQIISALCAIFLLQVLNYSFIFSYAHIAPNKMIKKKKN